jgi:hypothetical protein
VKPPACAGSTDSKRHCLHFPKGYWPQRDEDAPVAPPVDMTCCDCGMEFIATTFNRPYLDHGPHRQGAPMEQRQVRWQALLRVLPPRPSA